MALEHNLGIQIERFAPQIAQFNLEGAYGYYDPVFKSRAGYGFDRAPGALNPRYDVIAPPSESSGEALSSGLAGYLPTGLRYNLSADLAQTNRVFPQINRG